MWRAVKEQISGVERKEGFLRAEFTQPRPLSVFVQASFEAICSCFWNPWQESRDSVVKSIRQTPCTDSMEELQKVMNRAGC